MDKLRDHVIIEYDLEKAVNTKRYERIKKFEINRPGSVRVKFDARILATNGGVLKNAEFRVLLDGVSKYTAFANTDSQWGKRCSKANLTTRSTRSMQVLKIR